MLAGKIIERFGDLIATIGSDAFGSQFYSVFDDALGIEECTVFTFPAPDAPAHLVVEGATDNVRERARALAVDYVSGGYRVDPNVRRCSELSETSIYLARPQAFPDLDYRRHYYDSANVAHELVMLGRAGSTIYYSSFYRSGASTGFSHDDIRAMQSVSGFILKALHRHEELTALLSPQAEPAPVGVAPEPVNKTERERIFQHMKEVLLNGPHSLSQREAEVCAGIILGYSTLAIGLNLGISSNTVATHRKRGYAKLGICSQNELFVRYFTTVKEFESKRPH
jgi:DNA-binding CsgD family transcriptional regulator